MDLEKLAKAVIDVGILPTIILVLLYLNYLKDKAYAEAVGTLKDNTTALALLTAHVRGSHDNA